MSKKALLIIPPDRFNEDELFHPKAELENAGITVTVASTKAGEITGDNQGKANAEVVFSDVSASDYDVVAVIGGSGTIDYLWGDAKLGEYLKQAYEQKILVAGICAGSVVVAKTGLLAGRQATCYPVEVMIDELKANSAEYVVQHVVAHDDVITSDGPDGAREFGKSLVSALA
ncbi:MULTISPECIES: DJ-1/PfpI family protein [Paenibacillus]|uniref:DJ-1/PfpI family protein n=1 Tax=Paenibacillus rhizophilus TaxID=1850366 RepID=A0A3N9P1K4_9BACL|nr:MULTISPECIES: DJ-1/PfpI family protein [Paenibacillus]RQW09180.1 DJ-1/PfpI family protein [Paenibacillus rhizophilus]BCG61570.1 thiazole biosynthesis protein ThiJ [Paenibacillus sp. URB8-2]